MLRLDSPTSLRRGSECDPQSPQYKNHGACPELSEVGLAAKRGPVILEPCHRSNCPAASGYKLRRRGLSWYGLNVDADRHLGAIPSEQLGLYSGVEQHLGEG
jgi:hypothetical protein